MDKLLLKDFNQYWSVWCNFFYKTSYVVTELCVIRLNLSACFVESMFKKGNQFFFSEKDQPTVTPSSYPHLCY